MRQQKQNKGNIVFIITIVTFIFILLYRVIGSFFSLSELVYWGEESWAIFLIYFLNGFLFFLSAFFMFLLESKPPKKYFIFMIVLACCYTPFALFDSSFYFLIFFKHIWFYIIFPVIGFGLGFVFALGVKKFIKYIKKS